jgi:hypothetical protein
MTNNQKIRTVYYNGRMYDVYPYIAVNWQSPQNIADSFVAYEWVPKSRWPR